MARKKRSEVESSAASPTSSEKPVHTGAPRFCVVGIGASAGGIEAFKQMLHALPRDTGMAYVLVLHLPAGHESLLTDILGRMSAIPVIEVYDRVPIEHDRAYVLPAGADLDVSNGQLMLTPRQAQPGHHLSIDHFLHSLAKAIGIILSGNAADGTVGIQEIKAAGGITPATKSLPP